MAALEDYTVGATIGRGEFGTVKLGEHVESGRKVAMKFLDRNRLDIDRVQREISNQKRLHHKSVINIEDIIDRGDDFCIVQEYAPGGDLFDYILSHDYARLNENEARRIFRQLIEGVGHCHAKMVVHRDLKPENILMDADFNVKIADFGFSSEWRSGELLTESCGSPNYAAPELLSRDCKYTGPEIDVWSCGVVLYILLCGCLPFDDDNIPELFKKIKQGRYSLPAHLSNAAKDLITRMLDVNPLMRISLQDICNHSWFKDEPCSSVAELAPRATCNTTAGERRQVCATSRCGRNSKAALQAPSVGDRMRCRVRTANGRLCRYPRSPAKSASWPREILLQHL